MNKLDHTKSTTGVKENSDTCAPILTNIYNSCIRNGVSPGKLKLADISSILDPRSQRAGSYKFGAVIVNGSQRVS